jgi:hypothetical protein
VEVVQQTAGFRASSIYAVRLLYIEDQSIHVYTLLSDSVLRLNSDQPVGELTHIYLPG